MNHMFRSGLLAFLLLAALAFYHFSLHPAAALTPITPIRTLSSRVLLVPLDSRPPCRQHVVDLGRIGGIDVMTPPNECMDYYSQPGDTAAMRDWLMQEAHPGDAVIISIDQLLFGGLLAAREQAAPPARQDALVAYLRAFRAAHPDVPVYAFSILPRLTPQDTIDGYDERRALIAYSRLVGKRAAGLAVGDDELAALRAKISDESLATYEAHFRENAELNEKLVALTKDGTLTRLVLGQDDGEPYGIPNIEKSSIQLTIDTLGLTDKQCFLTHGADEIAQTLLAAYVCEQHDYHPRITVTTTDPCAKTRVMPYMAVDCATVAEEKIRLIGGTPTSDEKDANLTLFLSANDSDEGSLDMRQAAVDYFARELGNVDGTAHEKSGNADETADKKSVAAHAAASSKNASHPIALVDLSKHFDAAEPLLPLLMGRDIPVTRLAAYAGWNTTSNAIGTALAAATIREACKREPLTPDEARALAAESARFLQNRVLEDFFYLKADIDPINHALKKAGYTNTADLDLEHNHRWATQMLQQKLAQQAAIYKHTKSLRAPFPVPQTGEQLAIYDLSTDASFPWPRTFEIYLETTPYFALVK
ncbi:DUF4127 family protein [Selenomonas sp.]|uniref:DUF4127 family protein n=1 Tax=Selenomonas sp. TaxID=2053611 RepID=UPI0025F9EA98|nr:DUF4127 family protein [Selenomonas sp.]MCI6285172.1 DUF4127 family protein [Selenomonas sp.]